MGIPAERKKEIVNDFYLLLSMPTLIIIFLMIH